MVPDYWQQATRELGKRDRVMKKLIAAYPQITLRSRGDAFSTLARSIVGQQISVKAADSVWKKLVANVPAITPTAIGASNTEAMRSCGLSASKAVYLQDLARHFNEDRLVIGQWPSMSDDALIAELTQVKGIGRWTAEMFLIFYMLRPDVLPLADIGLQRAIGLHYNGGAAFDKAEIVTLAERWQPWRSVATWYLWRSLDPLPVEY